MTSSLQIGLLGVGAIGGYLAATIAEYKGWELTAWWDPDPSARARFQLRFPHFAAGGMSPDDWTLGSVTHLLEAAHPLAVPAALQTAHRLSATTILASVGGLLAPEAETALAINLQTGLRVLVPSGAIGGLDLLRAIPRKSLQRVTLRTRKSPAALPPAEAAGITEPTCLFAGTAREAIARFPKNVNVAVTLSLAGLGPDQTQVEVWADPEISRNTHEIDIESDVGHYRVSCANMSLADNPGTSALAAMSIVALLAGEEPGLRIGS